MHLPPHISIQIFSAIDANGPYPSHSSVPIPSASDSTLGSGNRLHPMTSYVDAPYYSTRSKESLDRRQVSLSESLIQKVEKILATDTSHHRKSSLQRLRDAQANRERPRARMTVKNVGIHTSSQPRSADVPSSRKPHPIQPVRSPHAIQGLSNSVFNEFDHSWTATPGDVHDLLLTAVRAAQRSRQRAAMLWSPVSRKSSYIPESLFVIRL